MPILYDWTIALNIDDVLHAQGADPQVILTRRPALGATTQEALEKAKALLHPRVLYHEYPVKGLTHERLELIPSPPENGKYNLSGKLIAQHLASSKKIVVMVCTIGNELDETVGSLFQTNPLLALALDGVGSAAVEQLAIQACNHFEALAKADGLQTSMPLNPGMVGWPVSEGQAQIFSLVDGEEINVSLTDSFMMVPNKSLSMVLGIGTEFSAMGSSCNFCSLNGVCKYQNHYARNS
jgi:hypothetical protein